MSFLSYLAVGLSPGGLVHAPSRKVLKRTALGLALVAGFAVAADAGHDYWKVGRFLQSTTNAYIRADYTVVLAQDHRPHHRGPGPGQRARDGGPRCARASTIVTSRSRSPRPRPMSRATTPSSATSTPRSPSSSRRSTRRRPRSPSASASLSYAEADNVRYGQPEEERLTAPCSAPRRRRPPCARKTAQLQKSRAGLLMAQRKLDILASERAKAQAQRDRSLAALHQAELSTSPIRRSPPPAGRGRRPLAARRPAM